MVVSGHVQHVVCHVKLLSNVIRTLLNEGLLVHIVGNEAVASIPLNCSTVIRFQLYMACVVLSW